MWQRDMRSHGLVNCSTRQGDYRPLTPTSGYHHSSGLSTHRIRKKAFWLFKKTQNKMSNLTLYIVIPQCEEQIINANFLADQIRVTSHVLRG